MSDKSSRTIFLTTLRAGWPGLVAVIVLSIFYFSFTSDDRVVGFLSDDAVYLLIADIYSPWRTASSPMLEFVRGENYFPPLYPLTMALLGVNTDTPALASIVNCQFSVVLGVCLRCLGMAGNRKSAYQSTAVSGTGPRPQYSTAVTGIMERVSVYVLCLWNIYLSEQNKA